MVRAAAAGAAAACAPQPLLYLATAPSHKQAPRALAPQLAPGCELPFAVPLRPPGSVAAAQALNDIPPMPRPRPAQIERPERRVEDMMPPERFPHVDIFICTYSGGEGAAAGVCCSLFPHGLSGRTGRRGRGGTGCGGRSARVSSRRLPTGHALRAARSPPVNARKLPCPARRAPRDCGAHRHCRPQHQLAGGEADGALWLLRAAGQPEEGVQQSPAGQACWVMVCLLACAACAARRQLSRLRRVADLSLFTPLRPPD
jgi:hypothetical protein